MKLTRAPGVAYPKKRLRGSLSRVSERCFCPPDAPRGCAASDQTHDPHGRPLCCPYDERAMAAFYRVPYADWKPGSGRRAAMRKRLQGTLEEIAQRAADTRAGR